MTSRPISMADCVQLESQSHEQYWASTKQELAEQQPLVFGDPVRSDRAGFWQACSHLLQGPAETFLQLTPQTAYIIGLGERQQGDPTVNFISLGTDEMHTHYVKRCGLDDNVRAIIAEQGTENKLSNQFPHYVVTIDGNYAVAERHIQFNDGVVPPGQEFYPRRGRGHDFHAVYGQANDELSKTAVKILQDWVNEAVAVKRATTYLVVPACNFLLEPAYTGILSKLRNGRSKQVRSAFEHALIKDGSRL